MSTYLTVAIPYVNATPHIGYAFELVEADVAARSRRRLGEAVRLLGGTDDYSLKNVLAAQAAGEPTEVYVARHADQFAAFADNLEIDFDDFIRTSSDPRHRPAVERLWRSCHDAGDLYRREYEGWYCVGCEQFYDSPDGEAPQCGEHSARLERVAEPNWFFRLSRYADRLRELIESDQLAITPPRFKSEVLGWIAAGLDDISVSRSVERAHGWGIPVPGDPTQVIYVWLDALTNYISALGFGDDTAHAPDGLYTRWWRQSNERIHVIGKGITRFHGLYWPAFLSSAGEPLPTRLQVHPYLTVDGQKISKSGRAAIAASALVSEVGADAVRWWCVSDVNSNADTDFSRLRLVERVDSVLANGFGNAVSRVIALRRRAKTPASEFVGRRSSRADNRADNRAVDRLAVDVAGALANFERRRATESIEAAIDSLNQQIEDDRPWLLAADESVHDRLVGLLDGYVTQLLAIADAIEPITPHLAKRARTALAGDAAGAAQAIFPRLATRNIASSHPRAVR